MAHIRHVYTEYDSLLKKVPWIDARRKVEEACLYRLVRWRGDDDPGGNDDLEQIVREVVVISDDDSDAGDDNDDSNHFEDIDSDSSLEIISGEEFALRDRSLVGQRAQSLVLDNQAQVSFLGSLRPPLGMEHVGRTSPEPRPNLPTKVDRRGFTRYRAWDQALERFRCDPRLPRLAVEPSMDGKEDQDLDFSHRTTLTKRPRVPSPAAESLHRFV